MLTEDEKREMVADARDPERRRAFAAARATSQEGSLDDYLDFLSEAMELAASSPYRITRLQDPRL